MERVFLEAPIPVSSLRRSFTEDIEFVINVKESKLKGKQLIVYLSNLDIKLRLQITDIEDALELAEAYMRTNVVVSIQEIEDVVINILLMYRGLPNFLAVEPERFKKFVDDNFKLIELWLERINSLLAFWLYIQKKNIDENGVVGESIYIDRLNALEHVPENDVNELVGLNYVNLIRHPLFPFLLEGMKLETAKVNISHFENFIFNRNKLLSYFADRNNPLFLAAVYNVDSDLRNEIGSETFQAAVSELKAITQEQANVPYLQ